MTTERAQVIKWVAIIVTAVLLILIMSGCTTRSASASISRTTGMQGGEPVELVTTTRTEAEAKTAVELGPMVQAAVKAATGDLVGAVQSLAARPVPPQIDELAAAVAKEMPDPVADHSGMIGGLTAAGMAALMAWLKSREAKRAQADADEGWKLAHDNALKVPAKAEA